MNTTMPQFIGITELRTKTREVFDSLKKKALPVVVMRESKPEAVIIPYEEYDALMQDKRSAWNKRLDELAATSKPYVTAFLKKKGYNPQKISGDKLVEILEKDDQRCS